jgi:hypothetical protein
MPCPYGIRKLFSLLILSLSLNPAALLHAGNDVLGEIELLGATKVEKTSGVWIDNQYIGYLHELKGSKKILLLPGEHEITVRQGGIWTLCKRSRFVPERNKSSA